MSGSTGKGATTGSVMEYVGAGIGLASQRELAPAGAAGEVYINEGVGGNMRDTFGEVYINEGSWRKHARYVCGEVETDCDGLLERCTESVWGVERGTVRDNAGEGFVRKCMNCECGARNGTGINDGCWLVHESFDGVSAREAGRGAKKTHVAERYTDRGRRIRRGAEKGVHADIREWRVGVHCDSEAGECGGHCVV